MKKKRINYKMERIVLSDILPYEVPPFFSNQEFYFFLVKNKVRLIDTKLCFSKKSIPIVSVIIRVMFGIDSSHREYKENTEYNYFKLKDTKYITIPYKYRIQHRNKFRELSIIHPLNQLAIIPFYQKYSSTIIYECTKSNYSIRKPSKVATVKYFKDLTNKRKRAKTSPFEVIETTNKEHTSLKSFFAYEKYSNIFRFYESFEFQNSEKKFDYLMKLDISRCFDSVYTHSISWALINKPLIKENLNSINNKCNSLGNKFDSLMQKMNYNETNGIVIGPELSRVFAELIFQRIDRDVEMSIEIEHNRRNKIDYLIFRYVDDYFLFYNDEKTKNILFNTLNDKLQDYRFYLNESKTTIYEKPIITDITIAKEHIKQIINETAFLNFHKSDSIEQRVYNIFSAKSVITKYKTIIRQTGISYGDIQNYFLASILEKTTQQINNIQQQQQKLITSHWKYKNYIEEGNTSNTLDESEHQISVLRKEKDILLKNVTNIIELVLFIYSVQPSVSYSIKVSNIFIRIIDFLKNQESTRKRHLSDNIEHTIYYSEDIASLFVYSFDEKHQIYKQIYDGIVIICNKKKDFEYGQDGRWYLLSTIKELGSHYTITEEQIKSLINMSIKEWGYFNIISVLGYIEDHEKYIDLRKEIIEQVIEISSRYNSQMTEHVLLIMDMLSCPFFYTNNENKYADKVRLLRAIKVYPNGTENSIIERDIKSLIKYSKSYFYQWKNRSFAKELNTKKGHFVY